MHTAETRQRISDAKRGKPVLAKRRKPVMIDGIEHYLCTTCEEFKQKSDFYLNKRSPIGITSECKKCHCRTSMDTRDRGLARDRNRVHMRRARSLDPDKFRERERDAARKRVNDERRQARYQLNLAVARGHIIRPAQCTRCGESQKLHAHHDDYSKPLEVRWLCTECHGCEHRSIA